MAGERVQRRPDLRATDWAVGLLAALGVMVVATVALDAARLQRRADVPPIDPGLGVPIAVQPVLEGPMARGEGPVVHTPMVPRGRRPRSARASSASPRAPAEAIEGALPPARAAGARARTGPARSPTDPGWLPSVGDLRSESADERGSEAPSEDEPASGGQSDDPRAGAMGGDDGPTGGSASGAAGSELEAQAIAAYRDRLSRWLSARFRVTGSGLSAAQLLRHRVRAVIRVGVDGTVEGYEVIPSGNAAFDQGASAALESTRGEPVPVPPDHYPRALQRELKVTFLCKKSQCS